MTSTYTKIFKDKAREAGFFYCGISKAEFLEEEAPRLEQWLKEGRHGEMVYMENHFEKRLDPSKLVDGAKSVVTLLYNYSPEKDYACADNYKMSKYAYGKDYHFVIKDKLKLLFIDLQAEIGQFSGRAFVDSAPVMERAWAAKSGAGWIGKNSLLLNKQQGSFFFLAELIIDLELEYDGPVKDYCGTCTRCIDACPTDAIYEPYKVDASKCISYFTIELKDEIPAGVKGKFENWIFGCDICQDVCPWNSFSKPHHEPAFEPGEAIRNFKKKDWEELTEEVFSKVFKDSPLKRSKFNGMKRNIDFIKD